MMTKLSVFCLIAGALMVSCAQQPVRFHAMSESELLAYNRDKPVMDQIYCEEGKVRTGPGFVVESAALFRTGWSITFEPADNSDHVCWQAF